MQTGTLFIVATPIGNMQDITLRALETLKNTDLILCEDTRHTGKLLAHFSIEKPLKRFDDFIENRGTSEIINLLKNGRHIALVSDAGTPLISDPGFKLVRDVLASDITVESLPGATAVITALTLSGLPSDKFFFVGFLPQKQAKRLRMLGKLKILRHPGAVQDLFELHESERPRSRGPEPQSRRPSVAKNGFRASPSTMSSAPNGQNDEEGLKATIILYESPHHLQKTLNDMLQVFGNIPIVVARELTKLHEETFRGTIQNAISHFKNPKGEFVILA